MHFSCAYLKVGMFPFSTMNLKLQFACPWTWCFLSGAFFVGRSLMWCTLLFFIASRLRAMSLFLCMTSFALWCMKWLRFRCCRCLPMVALILLSRACFLLSGCCRITILWPCPLFITGTRRTCAAGSMFLRRRIIWYRRSRRRRFIRFSDFSFWIRFMRWRVTFFGTLFFLCRVFSVWILFILLRGLSAWCAFLMMASDLLMRFILFSSGSGSWTRLTRNSTRSSDFRLLFTTSLSNWKFCTASSALRCRDLACNISEIKH